MYIFLLLLSQEGFDVDVDVDVLSVAFFFVKSVADSGEG